MTWSEEMIRVRAGKCEQAIEFIDDFALEDDSGIGIYLHDLHNWLIYGIGEVQEFMGE